MSATLDHLRQRPSPAATQAGQATMVEQARAVAEVAAAVQVAQQFPRTMAHVREDMEAACSSLSLAKRAFYSVPNRGTGPSVHLARELARVFGNFQYGVHELRRDDEAGVSEIQAFAWDVERNTRSTRTFISPHAKDTRAGRKALTDLNDVYLNNQNTGAKAVRECIFSALPQWLVDEAEAACKATLERGDGKPVAERAQEAVAAFAGIGVTARQLADRIGRPSEQWTPEDLASLEVVFVSIRRGETTVDEQFTPARVTTEEIRRRPHAVPDPAPEPTQDAAAPAPVLAERKAIQRLQILLRGSIGDDREKRLEWVEARVKRPVESTNELTVGEAALCIALAEKLAPATSA